LVRELGGGVATDWGGFHYGGDYLNHLSIIRTGKSASKYRMLSKLLKVVSTVPIEIGF
jgi:hypothetical protein